MFTQYKVITDKAIAIQDLKKELDRLNQLFSDNSKRLASLMKEARDVEGINSYSALHSSHPAMGCYMVVEQIEDRIHIRLQRNIEITKAIIELMDKIAKAEKEKEPDHVIFIRSGTPSNV